MNNNNKFIDDKGLSESTSLTHLLSDDDSADTIDINIIKHSPYYSESDFHNLQFRKGNLSILSLNCQSITQLTKSRLENVLITSFLGYKTLDSNVMGTSIMESFLYGLQNVIV